MNPIFQRYARSRLRPQALGVSLILTLMIAGFLFFGLRALAMFRGDFVVADAERITLLPMLGLQGLILFFLATGQVAGGITAEADEGMADYQRLTPMSPLSKALGYLFGLPIREYVMVAATLPFTAWALWRGEVPMNAWASVYAVFFCSALLYHLTGLVAGTVVKNRRWAFLISIAVIFVLYVGLPQLAKLGLTTLKYFTMWPVIEQNLTHFTPDGATALFLRSKPLLNQARFFDAHMSQAAFTLMTEGGLIVTFLAVVWRHWRRAASNLLGKIWAVAFMAWTQIMLLGNALPLIPSGHIFPTRSFLARSSLTPGPTEGALLVAFYGLFTLGLLLILAVVITPSLDAQTRGARRAVKLGLRRPPWYGDAATSFWFVLAIAGIGAYGWSVFARELMGSRWVEGIGWPRYDRAVFFATLAVAGLATQSFLERWGGRKLFLAAIFVGAAPLMLAVVMAATGNDLLHAATWISAASPLSSPVFATHALSFRQPHSDASQAFWRSQAVMIVVTALLILSLWINKGRIRRAALATGDH